MKKHKGEFCIVENGIVSDKALHEPILDNPEADEAISRQAIERAMCRGPTR